MDTSYIWRAPSCKQQIRFALFAVFFKMASHVQNVTDPLYLQRPNPRKNSTDMRQSQERPLTEVRSVATPTPIDNNRSIQSLTAKGEGESSTTPCDIELMTTFIRQKCQRERERETDRQTDKTYMYNI